MALESLRCFITSNNQLEFLWDYPEDIGRDYYVRCTYLITEEPTEGVFVDIYTVGFGPMKRLPLNDILKKSQIIDLNKKCRFEFYDNIAEAQAGGQNSLGFVDSSIAPVFNNFQVNNKTNDLQELTVYNTSSFYDAFKDTHFKILTVGVAVKEVEYSLEQSPFMMLKKELPAGEKTLYEGYVYNTEYTFNINLNTVESSSLRTDEEYPEQEIYDTQFFKKGNKFLEYDTEYFYSIGYTYQVNLSQYNNEYFMCIPANDYFNNYTDPIDKNYTYLLNSSLTQKSQEDCLSKGYSKDLSLSFINKPNIFGIYLKTSHNRTNIQHSADWVVEHYNDNGAIQDPLNLTNHRYWKQYDSNRHIIVNNSLFYVTHKQYKETLVGDFIITHTPEDQERMKYEYGDCIKKGKTGVNEKIIGFLNKKVITPEHFDEIYQRFNYTYRKNSPRDNIYLYQEFDYDGEIMYRLTNFNNISQLPEDYLIYPGGFGYIYHHDAPNYGNTYYILDKLIINKTTKEVAERVYLEDILNSGVYYLKSQETDLYKLTNHFSSISLKIREYPMEERYPYLYFSATQDGQQHPIDRLNTYKIVVFNELCQKDFYKIEFDLGYNSFNNKWGIKQDNLIVNSVSLKELVDKELGTQEQYKIQIIGNSFDNEESEVEIIYEQDCLLEGYFNQENITLTGFYAPYYDYSPSLINVNGKKEAYTCFQDDGTYINFCIKDKNNTKLNFDYIYIKSLQYAPTYLKEIKKGEVAKKHKIKQGEVINVQNLDGAFIIYDGDDYNYIECIGYYNDYFPSNTNFGLYVEKKDLTNTQTGFPWALYDFNDKAKNIGYIKYSANAYYNNYNYRSIKNYNDAAISKIGLLPSPYFKTQDTILKMKFRIDEMKEQNIVNEHLYHTDVSIVSDHGANFQYDWNNNKRSIYLESIGDEIQDASVFDIELDNNYSPYTIFNIQGLKAYKCEKSQIPLVLNQTESDHIDISRIHFINISTVNSLENLQIRLYTNEQIQETIVIKSENIDLFNERIDISGYDTLTFYSTSIVGGTTKQVPYMLIENSFPSMFIYGIDENNYAKYTIDIKDASSTNVNNNQIIINNKHVNVNKIRIQLSKGIVESDNLRINTLVPKDPSEISNVNLHIDNIELTTQKTLLEGLRSEDLQERVFEGIVENNFKPVYIYSKDFLNVPNEHQDIIYKITRLSDTIINNKVNVKDVDSNVVTITQQTKDKVFNKDFCINSNSHKLEINNINANKIYFKHAQEKTYVNCVLKKNEQKEENNE